MDHAPKALQPLPFTPLALGSIQPTGWLRNQLQAQASGLTGHLDDFWPSIKDSGWIGGTNEGWERAPYWLDGLVPLAHLLDDARLKEKAQRWMDYILAHLHEDGWIGPREGAGHDGKPKYRNQDPWPVFIILKVLSQHHSATGDERAPKAAERFLRLLDRLLDRQPLFDWNKMRWMDLVLSIHWLYGITGESWLLDLAGRIKRHGFDWAHLAENFSTVGRTETKRWAYDTHVVNIAMALKTPGVCYRQWGGERQRSLGKLFVDVLDDYHGQASGVFSGDENLAGRSPVQGTELCAVVEYMYSLEVLASTLGDSSYADRLEKLAYNALPATLSPDLWSHQYDQQANQVVCKVSEEHNWTTNGKDANLFGLEPNFGCCTANLHQGWPKFASHLWMKGPEGGLAAVAYAPCDVTTTIAGRAVRVRVSTDYPFRDTIHIHLEAESGGPFPLLLRIPEWAEGATVTVAGAAQDAVAGGYHRIDGRWEQPTDIRIHLPMRARLVRRFNQSGTIERGPLVYSLRIEEEWRQLRGEKPHADYEVHPRSPWNYALAVSEENVGELRFKEHPVPDQPFASTGAPVSVQAPARRLPGWGLERNSAAPPPQSPVESNEPREMVTLIPYGAAKLRVTEFPVLRK